MSVVVNKRLLRAKEASEYLSIGLTTLHSWVRRGKIPVVRIDSCTCFDVLELDEVVEKLKAEREAMVVKTTALFKNKCCSNA